MADDLGYESIGAYGGISYKTPVLDGMAREGIRFNHCYSTPLCTPSRVKIMTGRYGFRNYSGFGKLDVGEVTFGNVPQEAGYVTTVAGKWQLRDGDQFSENDVTQPYKCGFDEYCLWKLTSRGGSRYSNPTYYRNGVFYPNQQGQYGPDVYTDFILDFMERNKDRPFFVYFPMCLTHFPFESTPDSHGSGRGREYFGDMVEYMDKLIGRIVWKLDELGIRENTILMFTADNGSHTRISSEMNDGSTIDGGKEYPEDRGTRVPLIVQWKGVSDRGLVADDLIDFTDFFPTLAQAAGAPLPEGVIIEGMSRN